MTSSGGLGTLKESPGKSTVIISSVSLFLGVHTVVLMQDLKKNCFRYRVELELPP